MRPGSPCFGSRLPAPPARYKRPVRQTGQVMSAACGNSDEAGADRPATEIAPPAAVDAAGGASTGASLGQIKRTIALVGLMGVGKSTVGKKLAEAIGAPFVDSDDEIVKAAKLSVQEIFDRHGEAEFRRGERRVIERLLNGPPIVLATGGGAFMDPDTRALLKEKATTVWLRADLDVIWKRVSRRENRPLLKRDNPRQVLADLDKVRAPVYAEADVVVDSGEGPHTDAVRAIRAALG
jgi:shikimate kinase